MSHLISAVLAISLCAVLLAGGVNYLKAGSGQRIETESMASAGLISLGTAFSAYRIANRATPTISADPADWKNDLFPHYAAEPRAPSGMEWSYGEDVRGWWFCLSGSSVAEFQYQGLRIAGNRRGADVVEIRNICEGGLVYTPSEIGRAHV